MRACSETRSVVGTYSSMTRIVVSSAAVSLSCMSYRRRLDAYGASMLSVLGVLSGFGLDMVVGTGGFGA